MQEVIGSTPIFSTEVDNSFVSEHNSSLTTTVSNKTPTLLPIDMLTINNTIAMSKNFTQPFLNTGKPITSVPKGSTKAKEQAKADWYVEFSFLNPDTGRMQRFRKTHDGNRIKDPQTKYKHFTALLEAYKDALEAGWSPVDEQNNAKLRRATISISLAEGKTLFESYHKHKGTRPKSIATYLSKVNAFINHYGADTKVDKITDYEVTSFLNHQEATFGWVGSTYVNARINLNNFFKYLKSNKYIPANPVTDTETRRKIKTEKHKVFSDEDFTNIMDWLKANDPYALLFCRTIYYTCIRPKELRHLQLKHINLKTGVITVPANIAKNKRPIPVKIDPSLMKALEQLTIDQYSEDFYLFGCTHNIIGDKRIGENTPYNRFRRCLKNLNLVNKNYDMYSFKHLSNVRKFLAGWTVAQISKANRHSNISETETYLKDLLDFVEIDKEIPAI